jgi:moderate conductance mechanosensitive channel
MDNLARTALVLALLLVPVFVIAQDPPPANGNGEARTLPALPRAPYVREHADALQQHIDAQTSAIEAATTDLEEKRSAAAETGLSEEEQAARDQAVQQAESALTAANARLQELREALALAETGPTRAQLDARQEYDRLFALTEQVRRDLTLLVPQTDADTAAQPTEGDYAKAIRQAEEEQARIRELAEKAAEFEFAKSRVYEKLSDLEKLEYEIRWASERFQLSIDAYDHMVEKLFGAYVRYESRAFEGIEAAAEAQRLWDAFKETPAETLELPGAPKDVAALEGLSREIDRLLTGRVGERRGPHWMRAYEGRLHQVQREIDDRENYKEKLEQDSEKLKSILAEGGTRSTGTGDDAPPVAEPEEYQKLSDAIDALKQELKDNRAEIERLQSERDGLAKLVEAKQENEGVVEAIMDGTQARIDAILWQFINVGEGEERPPRPAVDVPDYFRRPRAVLFSLRERLKAENERLGAARRDTRQTQTQMDILDRRITALNDRNTEIEATLLPDTREQYYEEIGKTIGIRALKVLAVLFAAWLVLLLIRKIGEPLIEGIVRRADKRKGFSADEQQRARTLMTVFMTTARVVVYITAIMFAIAQFDVDYGPLLVAAGGVSLAVGFGAQTLVKDFFAGFFILLEGQFSIGDVVEVGGKVGTVENLNLRTTVLRSLNGDVHTIPNGQISATTNMTKMWSRAIVDIGIAYEENVDEVGQVLEAVAKEMRDDEAWGKKLLDAIYMGVLSLGDSSVVLRMLLKTRAGEQWGASREFQRRCKLKFDELGIEIPWPQRVVSYKSELSEEELQQVRRRKRANLLRYVRRMRGEVTEEEAELAKLSVEERDRAETMAKREAELAGESEKEENPQEQTRPEPKPEEELTDAERLARKLVTRQIEKKDLESDEGKDEDNQAEEEKKP